jgi:hypothetical protein
MTRVVAAAVLSAGLLAVAPHTQAQNEAAPLPVAKGFAALNRPTGIAEFGFGWITLPGAEVCVERAAAGCRRGDTSLEIDVWQLYRANLRFAFGAGITLSLITATDAPRNDPPGIEREHRRGYFLVEGIARYYPYVGENTELWLGLTGGLLVLSDRFESRSFVEDQALIGPRGVTIRTEGGTIGFALGGALSLTQEWSLGMTLRYGAWFLPGDAAVDPFGDEASLTGHDTMFSAGLSVAYRLPL